MPVPNPEDVLSVSPERIGEFINAHIDSKTLSVLIRRLNRDLLLGDNTQSDLAARALDHLGFSLDAV